MMVHLSYIYVIECCLIHRMKVLVTVKDINTRVEEINAS